MNPQTPTPAPASPTQQPANQPQNNNKIDGPTSLSPDSVKFYRRFVFAIILMLLTLPLGTFIYLACTNHVYKVKDGKVSIFYFKNRKLLLIIFGFLTVLAMAKAIAKGA